MTEPYYKLLNQYAVGKSKPIWKESACPVCYVPPKSLIAPWAKAIEYNKTEHPDETEEDLYNKCVLAIEAQTRFRRDEQSHGQRTSQPMMLSRWLNEGGWEYEIGSHAELKQQHEEKQPNTCIECNKETHPNHNRCPYHLSMYVSGDLLRQGWAKRIPQLENEHPLTYLKRALKLQ